jgi:hypothetical protein
MQSWKTLAAFAAAVLTASLANAAPSASEAAELGTTLTDIGAIKAGNADGSIPAYDPAKAIVKPVEPYKPVSPAGGFPYTDPFAAEKPLYSITAANMAQYAARLDDGTKYLLKKLPDYRIDVYPTHRTALLPAWVRENTVKNAARPKLVGDGDGVVDAHAQIPFPIPKSGKEAMWNAQLRYASPFERADSYGTWLVDSAGNKTNIYKAQVDYERAYWNAELKEAEYFLRLINTNTAPAAKAGEIQMRFNPLRMDTTDQNAWTYSPGQRRVRLAPEFKYDTVAATAGGIELYDEIMGFDGRMDRFDFQLVGRREMYIPYNAYKAYDTPIETLLGKSFVSPDAMRWELHRVWVVEATLKKGARHVYSKRDFFFDEDSWCFAAYNAYDQAGKLYRSSYWPLYVAQEQQAVRCDSQVFYDHSKGNYAISGWIAAGMTGWHKRDPIPLNKFSPDAMAGAGVR